MLLPSSVDPVRLARAGLARVAVAVRLVNRDPFLLVAALCAWLAARAMLIQAPAPIGNYDEALLFLNAQMMHDGRVIYRDFYSNYPPAIFQLIRGVGALGLPEIWTLRGLTFLVHVASAVLSGRLVGLTRSLFSVANRPRICWTTTACVLALQAGVGCIPFAYCYALLLLQVILLIWPRPGGRRWRWWLCGALIGVLSYLRHDLCVYVLGALGVAETLAWIVRRRSSYFGSAKEVFHLLGSAAATACLLWGPVFARAGFTRVLHDLVFDVSRLTMPARIMPIPRLTTKVAVSALDVILPAFMADGTVICLALSAVTLLSGVFFAARALRAKGPLTREQRQLLLLVPCALATVPQALGRTDYLHVAYVLPLTLAAGASLWSLGWARFFFLLVGVLPWFIVRPAFQDWAGLRSFWHSSENAAFEPAEDKLVADYLQLHTAPGEAIFVGCASHQRLIFAPLSPYYWGHRPGATRFMQLDPGLATATEGQEAMVRDLERTGPLLLLRFPGCWWEEPNSSARLGSKLLDDYLAAHYAPGERLGPYVLWTRKPAPVGARALQ